MYRDASVKRITDYLFQGLLNHIVNAEKIKEIDVVKALALALACHKVQVLPNGYVALHNIAHT
jgi:hypothetical protein